LELESQQSLQDRFIQIRSQKITELNTGFREIRCEGLNRTKLAQRFLEHSMKTSRATSRVRYLYETNVSRTISVVIIIRDLAIKSRLAQKAVNFLRS
jgi:hypothetical protein